MKKFFSFIAALLFAGSMMADSYTITFKEGTGETSDSSTKVTAIDDIIAEGAEFVSAIPTANNIYNARIGRGIKLGTSSKTGELVLTLAQPVNASAIIVNARKYNDNEKTLKVQDQEIELDASDDFMDYIVACDSAAQLTQISLASTTKRNYIKSVTVVLEGDSAVVIPGDTIEPQPGDTIEPQPIDSIIIPTTCAEAAVAALSVSENNELCNNGAVYTIAGYVTSIKTAYSEQYHNISFWMADTQDGGEVLQAYRAVCETEADAPAVGDYVAVTGSLTKYNNTPEFAAACTYVILGHDTIEPQPQPVADYLDVAAAIASNPSDGDEMYIRGVITKMQFKGKNFAKYGSVNIYVADATGAEGEFEFYNCYSLEADTFRYSTPDYDETSTVWVDLTAVEDGNGNEIHLGDTVIAYGFYKLYNTTHELNTGCYLVDVKHPDHTPVVTGDTIALQMTIGRVDNQYFEDYRTTDIYLYSFAEFDSITGVPVGDGEMLVLDIYPENPNNVSGAYSMEEENMDDYYTYMIRVNGTDTVEVDFAAGDLMVEVLQASVELSIAEIAVEVQLIGNDGNLYLVSDTVMVYYDFLEEEPQGVDNAAIEQKVIKAIKNGQLIIEKNGVRYNAAGMKID